MAIPINMPKDKFKSEESFLVSGDERFGNLIGRDCLIRPSDVPDDDLITKPYQVRDHMRDITRLGFYDRYDMESERSVLNTTQFSGKRFGSFVPVLEKETGAIILHMALGDAPESPWIPVGGKVAGGGISPEAFHAALDDIARINRTIIHLTDGDGSTVSGGGGGGKITAEEFDRLLSGSDLITTMAYTTAILSDKIGVEDDTPIDIEESLNQSVIFQDLLGKIDLIVSAVENLMNGGESDEDDTDGGVV